MRTSENMAVVQHAANACLLFYPSFLHSFGVFSSKHFLRAHEAYACIDIHFIQLIEYMPILTNNWTIKLSFPFLLLLFLHLDNVVFNESPIHWCFRCLSITPSYFEAFPSTSTDGIQHHLKENQKRMNAVGWIWEMPNYLKENVNNSEGITAINLIKCYLLHSKLLFMLV